MLQWFDCDEEIIAIESSFAIWRLHIKMLSLCQFLSHLPLPHWQWANNHIRLVGCRVYIFLFSRLFHICNTWKIISSSPVSHYIRQLSCYFTASAVRFPICDVLTCSRNLSRCWWYLRGIFYRRLTLVLMFWLRKICVDIFSNESRGRNSSANDTQNLNEINK